MSGEQETGQVDGQEGVVDDQSADIVDDKTNDLPQVNEAQAKALQKGWQTKEDWANSGKDPDEWISASHFNKNGEIFTQMQRLKSNAKGNDQRISDNNAFWKAQIEQQKQDLNEQRDEAIEDADKDEVKKLDGKISALDKQEAKLNAAALPQVSQEDSDTEQAYFDTLKPNQHLYAKQVAAHYITTNQLSGDVLVQYVDAAVKQQFPAEAAKPATNKRRENAATTDTGKRSTKSDDGKLTVDNLTKEDRASLQAMRNVSARYAKKSDAEMLKIIGDSKR